MKTQWRIMKTLRLTEEECDALISALLLAGTTSLNRPPVEDVTAINWMTIDGILSKLDEIRRVD